VAAEEPPKNTGRKPRRRGEAGLGTDEESAAKIRDAIKASVARAHGEWVQLEPIAEASAPALEQSESAAQVPESTAERSVAVGRADEDAEAPPPEMQPARDGVGSSLRSARLQRGVTLDEAAEQTRISRRYLEALENDSPPDRFPSPTYARFFVRDYAQYLGLDPAHVDATYPSTDDDAEHRLESPLVAGRRPSRRWSTIALVAAALTAIVVLGVTRIGAPDAPSPVVIAPSANAPPTPSVAPTPSTTSAPTAPTRIVAVLRVSEESWVEATADGQSALRKLLVPNDVERVVAKKTLQLLVGNPGGVALSVNGRQVPTGDQGRVAHLSFELRDGRIYNTSR
jgi:transcriptional regulator with XRE-family HTH domain